MPNDVNAPNCRCPYYISDRGRAIRCEGMIAGTEIKCVFASDDKRQAHQKRACMTDDYGKRCWYARAMDAKYESVEAHRKQTDAQAK